MTSDAPAVRAAAADPATPLARSQRRGGSAIWYAPLVAWGALLLMPLYWMVTSSVKETGEVFRVPPVWIPTSPDLTTYPRAMAAMPFLLYARNTVLIVAVNLVATVLTASMAGFGFSRMRFPLRSVWFGLIISTMMLPGIVTLIPSFILFRTLGWIDTFLPLTVPAFFGGGAFNIFLFRQFFLTIPYELDEAARIDGAGSFRVYWQILLPLSWPVVASVAVFNFVYHWNDFLGPLVYLRRDDLITMALGLRTFLSFYRTEWNLMMAASTITVIPVLAVFFSAQRYFIKGVTVTGFGGR